MLRAKVSCAAMHRWSLVLAIVLMLPITVLAQSTVSTGSIIGTVTEPTGAVVSGAKVTLTNTATGQTIDLTSNSAGAFNSGALSPGNYKGASFSQEVQLDQHRRQCAGGQHCYRERQDAAGPGKHNN